MREPREFGADATRRSRASTQSESDSGKRSQGAHQQARAENGMYRYKRIIGDRLRAQHREAQQKEALIAVSIINRMTALGMPESAKIVA